MSGDLEIDDAEASDGASDNDYSDHEHLQDPLSLVKDEDQHANMAEQKLHPDAADNGETVPPAKPKFDPKDPLRPRRKKARRACFACQRAHLTCGDERPCQRCIKRGLADACQDGVRKKAKYLHDAPPEALRPVLGPNYVPPNNHRSNSGPISASPASTSPGIGGFFSQPQSDGSPSYPVYAAASQHAQMAPPLQGRLSYSSQPSPLSPIFQNPQHRQSISSQGYQVPQQANDPSNTFGAPIFDPSNPALFSFDLEGLNFGNHYGALEFGMLGHMSSGVADASTPQDNGPMSGNVDMSFNPGHVYRGNAANYGQMYSPDTMPDFAIDRGDGSKQVYGSAVPYGLTQAYAIATGPASHHSPSTDNNSPASTSGFDHPMTPNHQIHRPAKRQDTKSGSSRFGPSSILGKRARDPSSIYDTVHEPYSYTAGFHALTALIQRRFSPNKTLRIAKSLASIRPSFISCTKTLTRQDLIFMEKCFQRTLFEYEDFMGNCCTPTLVCRRTGEIAAANLEFTLMTGWKKQVLLGETPNLNINTGKSDGPNGPPSGGRLTTPRMRALNAADQPSGAEGKTQPVFLAELMDDDSVIEFYEDFARLAFGDSRGSVMTKCKLLKYQEKEDENSSPESREKGKKKETLGGIGGMGNRIREIDSEHAIGTLSQEGKLNCSYCWTVKKDVFDLPMLIVMNFLPLID